jgi:signal transduction histidine kinase
MDIRVAIKWGVFYSGLTILVGGIYILLVCLFSPIFWGVREGQVITFSIFVAVATVCFYPLLNSVQKVAYKTLSHERREHQLVVKQFSEEVGSLMRIEEVLSLFLDRLHLLLKIRTGAVLLRDDTSGSFELKVSKGFAIKRPEEWEIPQRKDIVVWMEGRKEVFLKEEGELGFYADDTTDLIVSIGEIIKELDRFETKLCAPILSKGKLIGLLFLGEKGPGDMFSQEDLNAIRTLCNQVGIAIENIRLLDEVSKIREELHNQDKLAALGILTSKIAHEIKNPLVPIKTFVQLLPHKSSDQSFLKRFNSIVPQELERLEKVLDEILTVSRLTPSHLQEIKVEDVIKDTLLLVDAELSRQKIRVEENYFEPAHSIMGDAGRLKQAFMNLILNAAQAMNEGGRLSISTNLISGNDRDPRLEVKIQDDGVGISSENIKRIFEPFFTTRQSGTGLGLSIAKGIVEEHNGSICVESELGKGTIFTLTFPIQGKSNSSIS